MPSLTALPQGVTLIRHTPSWADNAWRLAAPMAADNAGSASPSKLFSSRPALQTDLAAADLPLLAALEQYAVVLLTRPHVLFLREVSLFSLAPQLPRVMTLHTARVGGNAVGASDGPVQPQVGGRMHVCLCLWS
jgi:hypothetical protein